MEQRDDEEFLLEIKSMFFITKKPTSSLNELTELVHIT